MYSSVGAGGRHGIGGRIVGCYSSLMPAIPGPSHWGEFPQGIRDVQIVINQPMDACRGRQQALKAILQLLTQVGRSFASRIDSDLSDCSEG